MSEQSWSKFWWTHITGASLLVSKVTQALLDNHSICIEVPVDLPWRHEMRSAVEARYREYSTSGDIIIDVIDAADECIPESSPGTFLLTRYGQTPEIQNGYRTRSGRSIQDYLKEYQVLKSRILWIKGLSDKQAEEWFQFCREYHPSSSEQGLFVLERQGHQAQTDKNIPIVRFTDHVTSYDVQIFCSFVLSGRTSLSDRWRQYLSVAVAALCETDAEVSELLINLGNPKDLLLLEKIREIAGMDSYSARGNRPDSTHVLNLSRSGDEDALRKRIWKAQIQTLLPAIEFERNLFVEQNYELLRSTLSENSIEQFKVHLTDPADIEIGTLSYLLDSNIISSERFPNLNIRKRISFLRKCRNQLAHAHCCSDEQVAELLG